MFTAVDFPGEGCPQGCATANHVKRTRIAVVRTTFATSPPKCVGIVGMVPIASLRPTVANSSHIVCASGAAHLPVNATCADESASTNSSTKTATVISMHDNDADENDDDDADDDDDDDDDEDTDDDDDDDDNDDGGGGGRRRGDGSTPDIMSIRQDIINGCTKQGCYRYSSEKPNGLLLCVC